MIIIKIILLFFTLGLILPKHLTLHDYDGPSQNQANHTLDITIQDDILIVAGMLGGIDFYNISNPTVLNHLDNLQLSSGGGGGQGGGGSKPNCIVTSENYVYITTSSGLGIINIANPSNPQYLGLVSGTNGYILENLDVYNNLLAVAAHEDGVLLYDISNPIAPNFLSIIETENSLVALMLIKVSFCFPVLPLLAGEKASIGGLEPNALKYENGAKLSFPSMSAEDTKAMGRGDIPDIIKL